MAELITHYGLAFVFINVLLERIGLPLPATPAVLVGAALAAQGRMSVAGLFGVAFAGCMIGDMLWYAAGWVYGRRVISMLCRVSLSPTSCVRQTETRFERWGPLTLVLAKFVPGLSTIARPLAGTLHMDWRAFAFLDGVGSALWVGVTMWAGMLFQEQIGAVLLRLREFGPPAFVLACAVIGAYLLYKWGERRRFDRTLSLARIDVHELRRLMQEPQAPVVIDLRSPLGRKQDPRMIPGAVAMTLEEIATRLQELPPDREIVLYCACPREATAVVASRKLLALGYTRVHPLLGGLDAWMSSEAEQPFTVTLKTAAALPAELR